MLEKAYKLYLKMERSKNKKDRTKRQEFILYLFCKKREMNKINYQKELERSIRKHNKSDIKPSLLLHVCCAPYLAVMY